jgi:hypothetical protein
MTVETFFHLYANTPLVDREREVTHIPPDPFTGRNHTLNDVYKFIHDMEENMRPTRIAQQKLISAAENLLKKVSLTK